LSIFPDNPDPNNAEGDDATVHAVRKCMYGTNPRHEIIFKLHHVVVDTTTGS